jgi:DNA-binding GntR family transcriptional regulator
MNWWLEILNQHLGTNSMDINYERQDEEFLNSLPLAQKDVARHKLTLMNALQQGNKEAFKAEMRRHFHLGEPAKTSPLGKPPTSPA